MDEATADGAAHRIVELERGREGAFIVTKWLLVAEIIDPSDKDDPDGPICYVTTSDKLAAWDGIGLLEVGKRDIGSQLD